MWVDALAQHVFARRAADGECISSKGGRVAVALVDDGLRGALAIRAGADDEEEEVEAALPLSPPLLLLAPRPTT